MKILLIQPKSSEKTSIFRSYLDRINNKLFFPPFTLEQLAGIITNKHEVRLIDERIGKKIDFYGDYDLIGITSFTSCINRAYEIADKFMKIGKKVVMGGYHPSALPKEAKQHCHSVVVGESEYIWPNLLKDIEMDKLKPVYIQDKPVAPNDIPPLNREQTSGYYFIGAVQATRGCPYQCEFCAISNMKYRSVFRTRPLEKVINEIESLSHKMLHFYDASLTTDRNYTKALFKEMKDLNKKFTCNSNVNVLIKDEEILKLASEAGCVKWFIGFESILQKNLNSLGKKNVVKEYEKVVKKIRDYDMDVFGLFMFGLDYDTSNIFDSTLGFILNDLELTSVNFYILTPLPGTPLYNRFEKEGRIITKDWSKYTLDNVVIKPKLMSPKELIEGTQRIKKEFHSFLNIAKHPKNLYFNIFYV